MNKTLLLCLVMVGFGLGCGDVAGEPPYEPEAYNEWLKFEPEGAMCANGSPYQYYAKFSETSDNVVIYFQGGGACWDAESCLGAARGATNIGCVKNDEDDDPCLPDNYAKAHIIVDLPPLPPPLAEQVAELGIVDGNVPVDFIYPLLSNDEGINPMADWNKVFIPYCTGDVYTGNNVATYTDTVGDLGDVTFYHNGHNNMLAVVEELDNMFRQVPKLAVGGCSAGGVGAISNYYFIRKGMSGVERGHLIDDAGPVFPSDGNSAPLHAEIRDVWGVDSVLAKLPEDQGISLDENFGNMSELLAAEFPNDRLGITFFQLDYNISLYHYERFWTLDNKRDEFWAGEDVIVPYTGNDLGLDQNDATDRAAVYELWWEDIAALREQYDAVDNLSYFFPFYRDTNSSHCATIPGAEEFGGGLETYLFNLLEDRNSVWKGTEIESDNMNVRDYVEHVLGDEPLNSYFEEDGEGRYLSCTPVPDETMCKAAVSGS